MSDVRSTLEDKARSESHGAIQRSEALSAGMPRTQIDRRVRRRQWIPSGFAGRFILPDYWGNPLAHLQCAVWASEGVVWRRSAMALRGLSDHPPEPEMLTRRQTRTGSGARLARYDPSVWAGTHVEGFLCLTVEHTVASMAGVMNRDQLDELIDTILRNEYSTWTQLAAVFKQVRRQGRRGSALLGRVLDERGPDVGRVPLSVWSRKFARALDDAGLAPPVYEWRVLRHGRLVAQVDLAYPELRYAIELDSVSHHLNREAFEEDRRRDGDLASVGWLVRRFTWNQYTNMFPWVIQIIRSDLSARRTLCT